MRRFFLACAVASLLAGCAGGETETVPPTAVVFFQGDSAALDNAAEAVVATAAAAAKRRNLSVRVLGFAAPPGSAGFNRALSDARARNVADGLRAQGVPAERIRVEPHGEVPFAAVPTESRRVEIILVRG
jgi:outer membrane protein OmpA-like peptidoglycan-associated protein